MSKALQDYRSLERRLWLVRWEQEGRESAQEDEILEEMDAVWGRLDDEERRLLNNEGPRCWPFEQGGWVPTLADAARQMPPAQLAYTGFSSVDETIESVERARAA